MKNVPPSISRRSILQFGAAFLAQASIPRAMSSESVSVGSKLTASDARRLGITGRTADLGDGQFLNPILAGDYSDPAVLKDGDDYYMSHSMCGDLVPGILIWHSRDLVNWEPVCRALSDTGCTVPEIAKIGDRYFIYYMANEVQQCCVITSHSISGPWSEPAPIGYGAQIDPGYIRDEETGRHYLFFSQGWVVELSEDGLKAVGEPKKVYDGWRYPREWPGEGMCLESPKLFFKDGYYYMVVAQGGTGGAPTSHMVAAARSRSLFGPWENSPYNPIVHTYGIDEPWWSRGHGPVIEGPGGDWWIVYHAYENGYRTLGRQTLMQPLEWTDDGWFRVPAGNDPGKPMLKPKGGSIVEGGMPLSDDFKGQQLGLQWAAVGRRNLGRVSLSEDGLRLTATKDTSGERKREGFFSGPGLLPDSTTLLAVIPGERSYSASVKVDAGENVEAGILLYYCPQALAGIGIGRGEKIHTMGSIYRRDEERGEGSGPIHLKIENRNNVVTLFWSDDGVRWKQSEFAHEVSGYHHNVFNGYSGLRVALYATGEGSATFGSFQYLPILES